MASYSPPAGADLYDDQPMGGPPKPDMAPDEKREGQDDGETVVVPKTILAGKKFNPGDEVVLKVVRIMDDQVELAYATGEEEKGEGESEAPPAQPPMGAPEPSMMD